jgi:hypothetical protein
MWNAIANGGEHLGSPCRTGSCATRHGYLPCDPPALSSAEALRNAMLTDDSVKVRAIVAANRDRVTVNVERAAIQVQDCHQRVIAHLPMSEQLASAMIPGR